VDVVEGRQHPAVTGGELVGPDAIDHPGQRARPGGFVGHVQRCEIAGRVPAGQRATDLLDARSQPRLEFARRGP
jgi:hypothetical protein